MNRATGLMLLLASLALAPAAAAATTPGQACEKAASDALRACVSQVGRLHQQCYRKTGAACSTSDTKLVKAIDRIGTRVLARCPDQAIVQSAGYGAALTPGGLVDRIEGACAGAVASLAARSYGGPHAAARASAFPSQQKCLDGVWRDGQSLVNFALQQQITCIRNTKAGKACDTAKLAAKLTAREASTVGKIERKCPTPLEELVAVDPATFVERASAQARCLVASAHGDTAPLDLDCGPRASVPVPARGAVTQVVLPQAIWGSRCGDGSDYAFRIRLAPAGSPVERIVVHMEGGGVCLGGGDCASKSADLFEALSDPMPGSGMMSSTAATNPFRDWTKVFLPYCTQDLHIGGGVATAYPQITVQRYGAVNTRAAMRYLRDVIWAELDATDPDGYRADRPVMAFAGSSAGGYGAAYNYHWVLDDLGWVHSSAVPDAALAMDNGTAGVITLGAITLPATFPGWNTRPFLPPYCFTAACAEIFVNLEVASVPRLLAVPEQQFLNVSNQIDATQRSTTLFASNAAFVNTLRSSYCAVQGTPGIRSFLRGQTTSIHGQLNNATHWDGGTIDGVALRDWLGDAMASPASVVDRVEEGALVADFPGVQPFPCALD